jgi:transcriptional regulator GlxA family with amidase domain
MSGHAESSTVTGRQRDPSDRGGTSVLAGRPVSEQIALAIDRELGAAGRSHVRSLDSRRMSRVMTFIGQHIERNFSVADLARVACMSPAHFARSFKTATGRSPHEFVSGIRLALAKQMLAQRDLPISDIALSAGFSSQSNFSRAFRDATGITPREYRTTSAVFE